MWGQASGSFFPRKITRLHGIRSRTCRSKFLANHAASEHIPLHFLPHLWLEFLNGSSSGSCSLLFFLAQRLLVFRAHFFQRRMDKLEKTFGCLVAIAMLLSGLEGNQLFQLAKSFRVLVLMKPLAIFPTFSPHDPLFNIDTAAPPSTTSSMRSLARNQGSRESVLAPGSEGSSFWLTTFIGNWWGYRKIVVHHVAIIYDIYIYLCMYIYIYKHKYIVSTHTHNILFISILY